MTDAIDITTDQRQTLLSLLKKHLPNVTVWAYGSRVKWTARPDSDLDVVVFATPEQKDQVAHLKEAFDESDLPFRVDLFRWDEVPKSFHKNISAEKVVLQEKNTETVRMGNEWNSTTLGNVVELKRGYDLPKVSRLDGKVPIISSAGLSGSHSKAKVKGPGVVTGRYGTIGKVYLVAEDFWPLNTTLYVKDFKGNDVRFISYFLKQIDYQSCSDKAAVPGVNRNHLHMVSVRIPPLPEQRAIAHILGSLDDKIELNRQMNVTLEGMAEAIFKSWFIDFDPVLDKAVAAGNPIPANLKEKATRRQSLNNQHKPLPPEIADLFPESFEDSELGPIPTGWNVGPILELADLISGGTPKTSEPNYWGGDVAWASAKDVSQCGESFLIETDRSITQLGLDRSAAKVIDPFTTVIVARGATTGRLTMFGLPIAMNQTCYALRSKNDCHYFIYCHARQSIVNLVHAGHGSVFNTITTGTFKSSTVLVPDVQITKAFEQLIHPFFSQILKNQHLSKSLAKLRDTLLPKLISGELTIPNVEKLLEGIL